MKWFLQKVADTIFGLAYVWGSGSLIFGRQIPFEPLEQLIFAISLIYVPLRLWRSRQNGKDFTHY